MVKQVRLCGSYLVIIVCIIIQGLAVSRVYSKQQYGNNYDQAKVRKRVLSYLETMDCRSDRE